MAANRQSEDEPTGLSTSEALIKLYNAIKKELYSEKYSRSISKGWRSWAKDAFHHNSAYSPFCWTSALAIIIEIIAISIFYIYGNESFRIKSMAAEIFFLLFFLVINACAVFCDCMLRHIEMHSKAKVILQTIEDCIKQQPWDPGVYPQKYAPQSPCISLQWTYRDNQLVNLPCHLLVEGDIILMRPGHVSPGKCKSIDKNFESSVTMYGGKAFAPLDDHFKEGFSSPQFRKPAKTAKFIMLETPYVKNVRLALEQSLKRPVTLFNRERHTVQSKYLERFLMPAVMIITLCVGGLHAAYFSQHVTESIEHLLMHPVLAFLPLLSLALPIYWIFLNACGMARLLALVDASKKESKPIDVYDEVEELNPPRVTKDISYFQLLPYFLHALLGKKGYLWRSANLLQVLGSITAFCCVDKKGILSWPNPTAEKVFFLKPSRSKTNSQDNSYLYGSSDDAEDLHDVPEDDVTFNLKKMPKTNKKADIKDHMYHPSSQVEVLDLTYNVGSPFGIQFDDPNWKSYLGNLKPLGLAILLNTCNPKSQEHYTRLSDHIACESLYNDAAVPVVNKRCLCELAKQIGFTNSVVDFYELQKQLGIFRHVHPEVVQKGRFARSLNYPRLKMPFPNISCAVMKDLHRGSYQLFSQGTADLVLDACNEYWDGEDICVLTDSDRKRILDFYHRSSLTAHCMSYAYGPVNGAVGNNFAEAYVELPPDGTDLFPNLRSTAKSARSWDTDHLMPRERQHYYHRCLSSDSLILSEKNRSVTMAEGDNDSGTYSCSSSCCLEQLGNEIFIGMVTMQYQASPDFVQLIEQLDKACIRFVHFSKENELRSRVFSEKMGLESGWNCHISLLSEKEQSQDSEVSGSSQICLRKMSAFQSSLVQDETVTIGDSGPRCMSAPSVVNLEMMAVKVDDEVSTHSTSNFSLLPSNLFSERDEGGSDPSFLTSGHGRKIQHESALSIQNALLSNSPNSPGQVTDSTDQSAPVTFDMSNRAKLPKGTENIRPHIENVDNVPLQVSLFTDCTPEATREMICIMQEYGEVVCCLGSSANCQNMPIFLQADVSIAIEPLYPQLCMQQSSFSVSSQLQSSSFVTPSDLSCALNSLPCALTFHRDDPISLFHLMMEARHYMANMKNSFQFMLCCSLSLSLLQILCIVFFLPPALPIAHVLWFTCMVIPLLSLSLMGNPIDSHVTTVATGKNLKVISKQTVVFFVACYCAKFCPSVIVAIFCFACMIASICSQQSSNISESCWIFMKIGKESQSLASKDSWADGLIVAQNAISFFLFLYFELISIGFIYRSYPLWKANPLSNKYWVFISCFLFFMQILFTVLDLLLHKTQASASLITFLSHIPFYVWVLGFLWPLLLIPLNELVKRHEIKMNVRQQKKARLEFCTKLGMNSPF